MGDDYAARIESQTKDQIRHIETVAVQLKNGRDEKLNSKNKPFPVMFNPTSGKEVALLPLPPLRTGRESFPSSGSSRSKAPYYGAGELDGCNPASRR
jgi:hypothetical protein